MPTTSEIRSWWAPACKAKEQSLTDAYKALDAWLKFFKYAPEEGHTGAFNCRPITGGTKYSLHAYNPNGRFKFWSGVDVTKAIAVDINWRRNPYGPVLITDMPPAMVERIKKVRTNNGKQVWRWGGDYTGNKDAMHYEVVCHPNDLATGINPATLPGGSVTPTPPTPEDDDDMGQPYFFARLDGEFDTWLVQEDQNSRHHVPSQEVLDIHKFFLSMGNPAWNTETVVCDTPVLKKWLESIPKDAQRREEWGQYLTAAIAAVGAKVGLPVDVKALATALSPLIQSGATAEEIAKAVVAEIAS